MNFEIVQKEPFKVVAKVRPFEMNNDGTEIPKFWDEYLSDGSDEKVMGMFGILNRRDSRRFRDRGNSCTKLGSV